MPNDLELSKSVAEYLQIELSNLERETRIEAWHQAVRSKRNVVDEPLVKLALQQIYERRAGRRKPRQLAVALLVSGALVTVSGVLLTNNGPIEGGLVIVLTIILTIAYIWK